VIIDYVTIFIGHFHFHVGRLLLCEEDIALQNCTADTKQAFMMKTSLFGILSVSGKELNFFPPDVIF